MTAFDEATAVRRRGEGSYETVIDPRFALVAPGGSTPPAINGGIMMATVLRAVLAEAPQPYPVATSANFLSVAKLAPAEIQVSWLKQGRTASVARAVLSQDGQPVLDTTTTTGTLAAASASDAGAAAASPADDDAVEWTGDRAPFPGIDECVDLGQWRGTVAADGTEGYAAQVEVLFDPATTGWRRHEPSGIPEMRGYVQMREQRPPDALLLAWAVDALPPVVFALGATGWAPTVELTWYMRAVPVPGPLQVASRSRHVSGGWFDDESEVWDASGRLVAQSRQLARVGRGRRRRPATGPDETAGSGKTAGSGESAVRARS